ncbi:U4/U6.U5 small nuclear ribonucleoprotein [Perilla frutescens var. hirtella]|uniref:U4/U6.U5 small nuclear ribonucleoprotein n=1 Tax=Perilla frutescens var. hirtella TaxID=608512 RepID=A0AAD4P7U9_PERFH|nr:U4/U6.U5 small nuclear ribonucleoprotein [Perilla frutescens var. hirtella]
MKSLLPLLKSYFFLPKAKGDDIDSNNEDNKDGDLMDEDEMEMEMEMMKKFGMPVGFDSTKRKPVTGNDVGATMNVTKRQLCQYMNCRGGFNRPLPMDVIGDRRLTLQFALSAC